MLNERKRSRLDFRTVTESSMGRRGDHLGGYFSPKAETGEVELEETVLSLVTQWMQ